VYEQLGIIYIVVAFITFTVGIGYFAIRGVLEHQRLINEGRKRDREVEQLERIIKP
jgi:hypothetical protein